jgi:hypothetical protein
MSTPVRLGSLARWSGRGAILLGLALACRSDEVAWQQRLAVPEVRRLAGLWTLALRNDPSRADSAPPWVAGQLALTLNLGRRRVSDWTEPPMFFGSYDLAWGRLGLGAATSSGIPAIAGRLRHDTLELTLGPHSSQPVALTGRLFGDSAAGRWSVVQRAGPGGGGDFVLRRR